jgi:hypothetical protein
MSEINKINLALEDFHSVRKNQEIFRRKNEILTSNEARNAEFLMALKKKCQHFLLEKEKSSELKRN